jgi:hypothetical protein
MSKLNLFQLAADLIKADPPPYAVSAWGFGSYAITPEDASDVDMLIVFENSAIQHREQIKPSCSRLQERFLSAASKQLHLERLTEKECADVKFIEVSAAILLWSKDQQPEAYENNTLG